MKRKNKNAALSAALTLSVLLVPNVQADCIGPHGEPMKLGKKVFVIDEDLVAGKYEALRERGYTHEAATVESRKGDWVGFTYGCTRSFTFGPNGEEVQGDDVIVLDEVYRHLNYK